MNADAATNPIRAQSIRALYAHMHNTTAAVAVILLFIIGTAWPFTRWPVIACWVAAIALFQAAREVMARRFERTAPGDAALERWARAYIVHQALAAVTWGAAMFLFAHPEQPVSVALTLCALFSVIAGAVPAQAYTPASFVALAAVMFALVLARLLLVGDPLYAMLGVAAALFAVAMVGYCRIQAQLVRDTFRVRFENDALVVALQAEKRDADNARRRAETASLAKSQFLAAASHDLRQPLYALSLFSASLETLRLDAEGRRLVARIGDSIAAMESLFAGLLDISRLEAGAVTPRLAAVSVDAVFDQLSQYFRPIARERGVDLRFRSDGEWIRSDATLLEQVLSNLVANALRATATGGVLVAARRRGTAVRLEVWDTGAGIAPADVGRIFDDFVQLGNPERDRRKGLGLGLAIAKRASALLGARIEVASRTGRGSRFLLAQPATTAAAQAAKGESAAPIGALRRDRALPVLVVEDDADVRAAVEQLLTRWGVAHDAVGDAEAAMRAASGRRYGLVLSDQRLGGDVDGLALLRALRRDGELAAALVTGEFDPLLAAAAAQDGVPVLTKPVQPEVLRALLGVARAVPSPV